jgi:hypothetical protein
MINGHTKKKKRHSLLKFSNYRIIGNSAINKNLTYLKNKIIINLIQTIV